MQLCHQGITEILDDSVASWGAKYQIYTETCHQIYTSRDFMILGTWPWPNGTPWGAIEISESLMAPPYMSTCCHPYTLLPTRAPGTKGGTQRLISLTRSHDGEPGAAIGNSNSII